MKYFIVLLSPLLLQSNSCDKEEIVESEMNFENTKWVLVELMGQTVNTAELDKEPYIKFEGDTNRISGNASCNGFFGEYELMEGNKIAFSKMGATLKLCPQMQVEDEFLRTIEQVESYTLDSNTLNFVQGPNTVLMRFEGRTD